MTTQEKRVAKKNGGGSTSSKKNPKPGQGESGKKSGKNRSGELLCVYSRQRRQGNHGGIVRREVPQCVTRTKDAHKKQAT